MGSATLAKRLVITKRLLDGPRPPFSGVWALLRGSPARRVPAAPEVLAMCAQEGDLAVTARWQLARTVSGQSSQLCKVRQTESWGQTLLQTVSVLRSSASGQAPRRS